MNTLLLLPTLGVWNYDLIRILYTGLKVIKDHSPIPIIVKR